ncbi:MAG TPA: cupin domain-containing protein [Streptosporangiaceae bacterium]|nr:cupin domain-containing protein [Streptosporangiaceae bacterium]
MVFICIPDFSGRSGPGCTSGPWASGDIFGTPVPLKVRRYLLDPGARARMPVGGAEAVAYVIAGSGTASASPPNAGGEPFTLGTESVLWLSACDGLTLEAGPDRLDVLLAHSTGRAEGIAPLCKVFAAGELPHLVSTRDTRDRLDLVTDDVPVGARTIRADRIVYHPGDTAAAHYHTDCHHVFCVLAGSGLLYTDGEANRLEAGMSALVGPGEVHWFRNDTDENFSFVEFWAPPPTGTVWTVAGDRCTWAAAGPACVGEGLPDRLTEVDRGRPA